MSLPGDELLQHAIDWGKQNLADVTQTASDLQIRWTNQGKQFPPPLGTVDHARWFGAGYPDYPWIFATDGEYTNFAAMALGQFEVAKDHLRTLRDISEVLNNRSGIVVHEAVSDGSIWFGHDSQTTAADGTKTNDFNSDETIKFPSAVALIWRWTGDNRFRDEMYDFAKRNLQVVDQRLDVDHDGWPEGSGNVERPGMGPEKLDNGVYYIRSLYDLADMARSKHDGRTFAWATNLARKLQRQFEGTWWDTAAQQYADSLIDPGNQQSFQKHWIGQVPMEAELNRGDVATPGVASYDHGTTALAGRENSCFSGDRPGSRGLFHTGCGGGPGRQGRLRDLLADDLDPGRRRGQLRAPRSRPAARYTDANAETMFSEPATGDTPDEQPGAMPEIFPSAPNGDPNDGHPAQHRPLLDVPVDGHAGVGQLRHRLVGRPPAARRAAVPQRLELQVVPQVPSASPAWRARTSGSGRGSVGVFASHSGAQLHDQGRRDAHAGARAGHRPHAAAGLEARGGAAGRTAHQALRRARDQPRARADGAPPGRGAAHPDHHDRVARDSDAGPPPGGPASGRGDDAGAGEHAGRLDPVVHAEAPVDRPHVELHGVARDVEPRGDLVVVHPQRRAAARTSRWRGLSCPSGLDVGRLPDLAQPAGREHRVPGDDLGQPRPRAPRRRRWRAPRRRGRRRGRPR